MCTVKDDNSKYLSQNKSCDLVIHVTCLFVLDGSEEYLNEFTWNQMMHDNPTRLSEMTV